MSKRQRNKWAVRRKMPKAPAMTQKMITSQLMTNPAKMSARLLRANLPTPKVHDYALRMDNLSEHPEPPNAIVQLQYEQYLYLKSIGQHRNPNYRTHLIKYFQYKHGPLINKYYFISPTNYDYLVTLARKYKYARYIQYWRNKVLVEGARQAGISQFIRELANPNMEWVDTRDPFMRELDAPRIEQGLPPIWIDGPRDEQERRTPHKIAMTQEAEDTLYKIALQHMIINRFRPTLDKTPVVSFLLEVIGQKYLTPKGIRVNSQPRIRPYRSPKDDYGGRMMTGEGWSK